VGKGWDLEEACTETMSYTIRVKVASEKISPSGEEEGKKKEYRKISSCQSLSGGGVAWTVIKRGEKKDAMGEKRMREGPKGKA